MMLRGEIRMSHRFWVNVMAASMYIGWLAPARVAGQPSAPARKSVSVPAKAWTPPRTPDGQPDLEGVWAITVLTPLERPRELGGKEFLTEEEAAQFVRQTLDDGDRDKRAATAEADLNRNYNEFWRERGNVVVPNRRTSLIVDPRDGRIPPFTPEAQQKRAARTAAQRVPSGPEDLALRLRCITRGLPMVPTPNNNFFEIVQSPEYVVILQEMMYEARVIPLDGRPHLDPKVRAYMGDARGHWEGDTLVIETTNFFGQDDFHSADENLRVTERLTRTAADSIRYEFTVNDPTAFTRPWSGEIPFVKSAQQIFDYECHEGNYAMIDILAGARAEEKKSAAVASK
jgi:hypothetical protein